MRPVPGVRLATEVDLPAVTSISAAAYAGCRSLPGRLPATEDYAPRIAAGQVWAGEMSARWSGSP